MAHTLIYCHLRPFTHTEPFLKTKKTKQKEKNKQKKFSSFTCSYPSPLICVHRLVQGLNRTRNTKKEQRVGFGGLQGEKFKFVILHVQVSIKMLQLVQLSCQQDRLRAGQVPS